MLSSCERYTDRLTLIGSAGTFEIFLPKGALEDPTITQSIVNLQVIKEKYEEILYMDMNERSTVSWLPSVRSKYIVVALILMQTIIEEINPESFIVSKYALKEGAILRNSGNIRSEYD